MLRKSWEVDQVNLRRVLVSACRSSGWVLFGILLGLEVGELFQLVTIDRTVEAGVQGCWHIL